MFSVFFIHRPIFASVISILIMIAGVVAMGVLPVAQFPEIVPPVVRVTANYPGASAQVVADTVAAPIEQQVNGVEGMIYMQSTSASDGSYQLDVTFDLGTDPDMATVLTQNRVSIANARLPSETQRQGITTKKQSTAFVLILALYSPENLYDDLYLANYATINIRDELSRIKGVGDVSIFPAKDYGMRIWLDPEKLKARELSASDVVNAVREQNVQVASGSIGLPPAPPGTEFQLTVSTLGRLESAEQFEEIIVKTSSDGRLIRVRDIGRVELGAKSYTTTSQLNAKPSATIIVYQSPGANSVKIAEEVIATLDRLKTSFPKGLEYTTIYDVANFVKTSIGEVYHTIIEAAVLVILVVMIFLQSWRATLIPTIVIPVALIGTFAVMLAFGFSINTLTLFGMVLAIGIVVDDAIVVVENVERIMAEEHLSPKEATAKAMGEVFGPIISISLVLMAVFLPSAVMGGVTGQLFRQFAITIAVTTLISAINSLTLSPAMCGLILKAHQPGHTPNRFVAGFNRAFDRLAFSYASFARRSTQYVWLTVAAFAACMVLAVVAMKAVPKGFLPEEDQGLVLVDFRLPDSASLERTQAVIARAFEIMKNIPGIKDTVIMGGFSAINGNNSNNGYSFASLDSWDERLPKGQDFPTILKELRQKFATIEEGSLFTFGLPAILGLGQGSGYDLRIQDRTNRGAVALQNALDESQVAAMGQTNVGSFYSTYRAASPQIYLDIDREKIKKMGIPLQSVFDTLQANLGSAYVNDFNRFGRTWQVNAQADSSFRSKADDIKKLEVRSPSGAMIPLGALLKVQDAAGPERVIRYNLYPSASVTGASAPGISSGQTMSTLEGVLHDTLPPGMAFEWTNMSYQERMAGGGLAIFAMGLLVVYLVLAAQYESWLTPLAVILTIPLAILGSMVALKMRGLDNNVYTQVGLTLLIGLVAKNAILIVEFAKVNRERGMDLVESAVEAARTRLRPILMTSFAFILGVVPLAIATGAGAASRVSLGTGVIGGMLIGTILSLVFTPMLFVVIQRLQEKLSPLTVPPPAKKGHEQEVAASI